MSRVRRSTRQVVLAHPSEPVAVGGGAPVSVQSMTTTRTSDHEATLEQIYALAGAGADIVRCTCNDDAAAEGLARIVPRSPVPIVADVHFQHRLALAALEAGVSCLRLNPGNIRKPEQIKAVATEAGDRGVPIRIGVNAGSSTPTSRPAWGSPPRRWWRLPSGSWPTSPRWASTTSRSRSRPPTCASWSSPYRLLADTVDAPLHLGVTEAGPPPAGLVKATAGIATLLLEGIGDTIRYSLTADPVEEARAGRLLLEALGLRERTNVDLIACPSCGRAEIDVIKVAADAMAAFAERQLPLQVAVMGCVVNGPGEARSADLGIAAGRRRGHLFIRGQVVRVVPEEEMVAPLVEEAEKLVEEGSRPAWPLPTPAPPPRPRPTGSPCWSTRATTPTPAKPGSSSSAPTGRRDRALRRPRGRRGGHLRRRRGPGPRRRRPRRAARQGRPPLPRPCGAGGRGGRPHGAHAVMAALLHDVVEDCGLGLADLEAKGVPVEVVSAVDALTKRAGEPYLDAVRRAARHPLAAVVKRADNADNADEGRLARLDADEAERLRQKYRRARAVLDAGQVEAD